VRKGDRITVIALGLAAICGACGRPREPQPAPRAEPVLVWGRRGEEDGNFIKPRAAAADRSGRLYVVDMSGRIQRFGLDGRHELTWRMPERDRGFPTGLGWDTRSGTLLVAETHRACVSRYSADGALLGEWGREGSGPGEFIYPTDVAAGPDGRVYVTEYGQSARVMVFDEQGRFLKQWGGLGMARGQLQRPMGLDVDARGTVYVADSCNHRIQVFDSEGNWVCSWGEAGEAPGQLKYPWDVSVAPDGSLVVCEYGNNRIQKFRPDGTSLGVWGRAGREVGCLASPWGAALGPGRRVVVVDALNHRLQVIQF